MVHAFFYRNTLYQNIQDEIWQKSYGYAKNMVILNFRGEYMFEKTL